MEFERCVLLAMPRYVKLERGTGNECLVVKLDAEHLSMQIAFDTF